MRAYLLSLFAVYLEGYVYLYLPEENRVYWYSVDEIEQLIEDALRFKDKTVFVSVHPSKQSKSSRKRSLPNDISGVGCVFLDFDIADDKAHAEADLPQSLKELLNFLEEIDLKEKLSLYHSGHGVHGYASLETRILIKTDDDLASAERVSKGLNEYIKKEAARRRGWKFDNVAAVNHVARLPGSFNHKTGDPKLVHPISLSDYKFSVTELEALSPAPVPQASAELSLDGWVEEVEKPDSKPKFAPIIKGCTFVRHCIVDAATLPEPEWKAVISITARCENGEELSHRVSKPYARYSYSETAAKVATSLRTTTGPATCRHIKNGLNFQGCHSCPLSISKMKSPISLGFIDSQLAELFSRYVYDLKTKRFYEVRSEMEV